MNKEIRADLAELADFESSGEESSKYPRMKSAFIWFNTQFAAYMACQTLLNADPLHSWARHINFSVRELRWSTLSQRWWNRYIRSHRFSSHDVGDTRRIHGFPVLNCYPRRLRIVASLDSWCSGVAEWDHSRCAAAVDASSTDRIAAAGPAYYHGRDRWVYRRFDGAPSTLFTRTSHVLVRRSHLCRRLC